MASPPRRCGSTRRRASSRRPGPRAASAATPGPSATAGVHPGASNVGLSLDEIAAELDTLPHGRTPTAEDWRRISEDWRARLDERIAAIEALRDRLDGCIGCGCLSLRTCSLYNPEDVIGTRTSGAGRLPELLRRPGAREREAAQPQRGLPESVVAGDSLRANQPDRRTRVASAAARPSTNGDYTARHLQVLEGLEAVRKRPGMYIGSRDSKGLMHCLWEIIDNAVDEALAGAGNRIEVVLHADRSVEVLDQGRGIPVDTEPRTGLSGVEVVFTKLHAGGKFGGTSYAATGGLHGVGASVVNALSPASTSRWTGPARPTGMSFRRGEPGTYADRGEKSPGRPSPHTRARALPVVGRAKRG